MSSANVTKCDPKIYKIYQFFVAAKRTVFKPSKKTFDPFHATALFL